MSLAKSDVKLGFMEEIAKKVDAFNKDAERRATEYDAMALGFKQAVPRVASLMEAIDQDLEEEGKLEEIGKEPILVAKYAKEWVKRSIATLQLMGDAATDSARQARGRVSAFGTTLDFLESLYVKETTNKKRIEAMLAAGELMAEAVDGDVFLDEDPFKTPVPGNGSGPRPMGVRPAPSIAQRRRVEEAQRVVEEAGAAPPLSQKSIPSTSKAAPEPPSEPAVEDSQETLQEAVPEPPEDAPAVEESKEERPQEAALESQEEALDESEPEPEPEPEPVVEKPKPAPREAASKATPKTPKKRTRRTRAKEKKER